MKLLLDENLPHDLRKEIVGHDVFTVTYMGWMGLANGALLTSAAAEGFDAFITTDRGLEYEQNQKALPVAIVVLLVKSNAIELVRPLLPALHAAIKSLAPRSLVKIGVP